MCLRALAVLGVSFFFEDLEDSYKKALPLQVVIDYNLRHLTTIVLSEPSAQYSHY